MNITRKDIEDVKEFLKEMEILQTEKVKDRLTGKDWMAVMKEIRRTGEIPEEYKGRIGEAEIEVWEDMELITDENGEPLLDDNGDRRYKHVVFDTPQKRKTYYDLKEEAIDSKYKSLDERYHEQIQRVYMAYLKWPNKDEHLTDLSDIIDMFDNIVTPELLDITDLPNLMPTSKNLQYAITPYRNQHAYIMPFNFEDFNFEYNENGEIILRTTAQYEAIEKAKDKENEIKATGIDQPLLRQIFAAASKAYLSKYGNSITVNLNSFAREMNIDISGANMKAEASGNEGPKHNSNNIFKKFKELENLSGVWQGGSFYRVFLFEGYDAEQNTLTFSTPWFWKIARETYKNPENKNKKTRADGSIIWEITGVSTLMKSSIVSARSKPTVEIVARLITGLQQYGVTPEAKRHKGKQYEDKELIEYKISFNTLINEIPLITENLKSCKDSNKTTLLQRYFCGSNFRKRIREGKGLILEEYINKYTYLKEYYKDFEISFQPPTVNTLSETITIRHHGINGNFKQNNSLNEYLYKGLPPKEDEPDQ